MLRVPDLFQRDFPEYVDGSAFADFKLCETRFYWSNVRRLRPGTPNVHLTAGGAFAKGLEVARLAFHDQGESEDRAQALGLAALLQHYELEEPPPGQEKKGIDRVAAAFESYLDRYPLSQDSPPIRLASGRLGIELTFALDIGLPAHPVTGNPILFCGKIDYLALAPIGLSIVDEKTCSSLEKDTSHWNLKSQFPGYAFAAAIMGFKPKYVIVRRVALYKEDIGHQDILLGVNDWKLDRWYEELYGFVKAAILHWQMQRWPQALNDPCSMYGGCPFRELCNLERPHEWETASGFIPNTWNPLAAPLVQIRASKGDAA